MLTNCVDHADRLRQPFGFVARTLRVYPCGIPLRGPAAIKT